MKLTIVAWGYDEVGACEVVKEAVLDLIAGSSLVVVCVVAALDVVTVVDEEGEDVGTELEAIDDW